MNREDAKNARTSLSIEPRRPLRLRGSNQTKDGVRLPIPDSVRSIALSASDGSLGYYNYEYSLGVDNLPGNMVAGNYTLWVLDGNGERDSRNVTFSIGGTQGLLWIQFDQG